MASALALRIAIATAAGLYLLVGVILGVSIDSHVLLKWLGAVTTAVVLLFTVFDLWAWRWIPAKITKRPVIDGAWRANLVSLWPDPATGEKTEHTCYLVVRQTFSRVSVTSLHPHSRGVCEAAAITNAEGECKLAYIYWSAATATAREGNPPHRGAATLVIARQPRVWMQGDYWTERDKARGTLTTTGHSKKHYDTFEDADRGDYA